MSEKQTTDPEASTQPTPIRQLSMPSVPGWYLVELSEIVRRPKSGFEIDYCRKASKSDGDGMQWLNNYRHSVVTWHELPKRVQEE